MSNKEPVRASVCEHTKMAHEKGTTHRWTRGPNRLTIWINERTGEPTRFAQTTTDGDAIAHFSQNMQDPRVLYYLARWFDGSTPQELFGQELLERLNFVDDTKHRRTG